MTQLVLGTAEFNKDGYAGKPCPEGPEIIRILNLAYEGWIRTLDCADTYGTERLEPYFGGFSRINKSKYDPRLLEPNEYYHYGLDEPCRIWVNRAAVYTLDQIRGIQEAIVPFNINNTTFRNYITDRVIVRSVFDRGRLLEEGYTVKDCLSFVKRHGPGGVIVGVNSVKELEEILKAWGQ